MTKFCLPIIKNSLSEVEETIKKYPDYDLYEVWVDYIERHPELVKMLKQVQHDKKLILCFRRKNGEPIYMSFVKRKAIVDGYIDTNILIDCDIEQQKEDLDYISRLKPVILRKVKNPLKNEQEILRGVYAEQSRSTQNDKKLKVIASYHNYKKTPDDNELNKIITTMQKYNPEIYKIATYCQNPDDAVRLMQLLLKLKKKNKKAIILGMGEYGKITRVFGALYGNQIIFTSENNEESAPGQMTREKLRLMINDL